ncbi:hypothetical protein JOC78_000308 [Bacillus ectoiniformans]|nr:hypothetical protein [Bacillus ectoiniformans]
MSRNTFFVFFLGFSIGALILGFIKGEFNWSTWIGMIAGLTFLYLIINMIKK